MSEIRGKLYIRKIFFLLIFSVILMLFLSTNSNAATEFDSLTFDAEYYLNEYDDLRNAFHTDYRSAYEHFLNCGIKEGRRGSPYFDVKYYMEENPDLVMAFGAAGYEASYNHFYEFGLAEGRTGSPYINPRYYVNEYPDLRNAFNNDYKSIYKHFYEFGIQEGRRGSKWFGVKYYLNQNTDLANAFGAKNYKDAFNHFLRFGINELRPISPDVDLVHYYNSNQDLRDFYGKDYKGIFYHCCENSEREGRKVTHTLISLVGKEPTCTEEGIEAGQKCETCGMIIAGSRAIPPLGHDWAKATFNWVADLNSASASAVRQCNRCHEEVTVPCSIKAQEVLKATCEKRGTKMYTATADFSGDIQRQTRSVEIPAFGHNWNVPKIEWDSNYNVKVTFTCQNDIDGKCSDLCTRVFTKADKDVLTVKEEAIAGDNEHPNDKNTTKYTVSGEFGGHKFQDEEIKPVNGKTHDWEVTKVEWVEPENNDSLDVKATLHCKNGNHADIVTTEVTVGDGEVTTQAKCTTKGEITYKNFTVYHDGKTMPHVYETGLKREIPVLGHSYYTDSSKFEINWTEATEHSATATVTRECSREDCSEKETASEVTVQKVSETFPSCEDQGEVTWEATVKFPTSGITSYKLSKEEQLKKVSIEALGHLWKTEIDENEISWENVGLESNDEEAKVTVELTCDRAGGHSQPYTVTKADGKITVDSKEATCGEAGYKKYTATVEVTLSGKDKFVGGEQSHTFTIEKEYEIPQLPTHSSRKWEESDSDGDGMIKNVCKDCGKDEDTTQVRVVSIEGLKAALKSTYTTIELATSFSSTNITSPIDISKIVTIKSQDDAKTLTGDGSVENLFNVSNGGNVTFDNVKLSGGTKGAVKAQNGAQVSATNGTSYETENYDVPFVYTDNRSSNPKVSASGKKINGVIPQKLKVWDGDKNNAYSSVFSVGDTLEDDDSNNDKYYFIDSKFNSKFAKITYTSERSVIGGLQVNFVRYYDLKENAGTKDKIEPPDGLKYITTYTTGIATYSVESYVSYSNLTPHTPGSVPAPTSSLINYLYSIKLVGSVSGNVEVVNNKQALITAVDTGDKNIVVINGEIDLEGETLDIKKEGVTILGHVKNGGYRDGSIKGMIKVSANNVVFESLTINGYSSSDVSSEAIVTVSGSGFKSNSSTYKSDASVSGDWQEIIHFTADKPTATLFYNVFNGDKAKALMKFDKIDQEIIKSATEIETSGTRIIGNDLVSGSATEKQIIISDFSDIGSVGEGKQARLYIALNEVDIVNNDKCIGLDVKAKDGVTVQIGSVYFVRHYEGEPASKDKLDEAKNAKQKFIMNIDNSGNATNFTIKLSSTQNLPKDTKWSSTCREHPEDVKIEQEGVTYNGNGTK